MPRPRKSKMDEFLDIFADWSAEDQEAALDVAALLHRQTKRRESRENAPERKPEPELPEVKA
jgi:hypothetical protein